MCVVSSILDSRIEEEEIVLVRLAQDFWAPVAIHYDFFTAISPAPKRLWPALWTLLAPRTAYARETPGTSALEFGVGS